MTNEELLRLLERIMAAKDLRPQTWAKAAGLSEAAVRALFGRAAEGKMPSIKVSTLGALLDAVDVPLWAIFYPDDAIISHYLKGDAGEESGAVIEYLVLAQLRRMNKQQQLMLEAIADLVNAAREGRTDPAVAEKVAHLLEEGTKPDQSVIPTARRRGAGRAKE